MAKETVIFSKTTKFGGEWVKAGDTIEVSPKEKEALIKADLIEVEKVIVIGGAENEALIAENEALKQELELLKKSDSDLLGK